MAGSIEKISLMKPSQDDTYDIGVFNRNSEKLEGALSDISTAFSQLGGDMEKKIAEDTELFFGVSKSLTITVPRLYYVYNYVYGGHPSIGGTVGFQYFPINVDFKIFSFSSPDTLAGMDGSMKVFLQAMPDKTTTTKIQVLYDESGNHLARIAINFYRTGNSAYHISSNLLNFNNGYNRADGVAITRVYVDMQDVYQLKKYY